jgi:hypothetical protein
VAECGIHEECLTLKLKVLRLLETQVNVYQSAQRNVPDDLNLQQHRCGSLESSISRLFVLLLLPNVIRDIFCRFALVITLHPLQLLSNSVFFSNSARQLYVKLIMYFSQWMNAVMKYQDL